MLGIYFDEYYDCSDAKRKNMDTEQNPVSLMIDKCDCTNLFEKEDKKPADTTLKGDEKEELANIPTMPPLEVNKELKEGTGINILTPKTLLTRLSVLLAQIKAGSNP